MPGKKQAAQRRASANTYPTTYTSVTIFKDKKASRRKSNGLLEFSTCSRRRVVIEEIKDDDRDVMTAVLSRLDLSGMLSSIWLDSETFSFGGKLCIQNTN